MSSLGVNTRKLVVAGVVALVLLVPARALADARAEARRHFRAGMDLIARGQPERGIEELKAAYAAKPHPNVLFNIARAELDLGDVDAAIDYFDRYLAADPDDAADVAATLDKLKARRTADLAKKSAPPAAVATKTGPHAPGADELARAAERLNAIAAKLEAAQTPAPPVLVAEGDRPRTRQSSAGGVDVSRDALRGGDVFDEKVVAASRREQSTLTAPSATTIISADDIRLSGAQTIPELLRRVPGVDVAQLNNSDTDVSIRGFNRRLADKVLVLVDGRSQYQDYLGATLWSLFTIDVADIERIEVVRGPGSALYGANAFAGVVNIITKSAQELAGDSVLVSGGTQSIGRAVYQHGARSGRLAFKASAGLDTANKWSRDAADPAQGRGDLVTFGDPDLSRRAMRADAAATWDLARGAALTLSGGVNRYSSEVVPIGALRSFGFDGTAGYLEAAAALGPVKLSAVWNHTDGAAAAEYSPAGGRPFDSAIRMDVVDAEAQGESSFSAAGPNHVIAGASFVVKRLGWNWIAGERASEVHAAAFLQDEWQPAKALRVVASYRADRHPLLADNAQAVGIPQGIVQSPRLAVLYSLTDTQVIRVSAASAFRVPTMLESYISFTPPVPDKSGISIRFQGDAALRPEYVQGAELGYRAGFNDRLSLDGALYVESVTDLIVQGAPPANAHPPGMDFDPASGSFIVETSRFQNDPQAYLARGVELSARASPVDGVDLLANYAYEEITAGGESTDLETPRHKVFLGAQWRTRLGLDLSADFAASASLSGGSATGGTWVERGFAPDGSVQLTPYTLPAYALLNARVGWRATDKVEVGVSGYNLLDDEHREHPFGNLIGRRLVATVQGSF